MGFSLKKIVKSVSKVVKKVAPIIQPGTGLLTNPKKTAQLYGPIMESSAVVPGAGGFLSKVGGFISTFGKAATDLGVISGSGNVGNTGMVGDPDAMRAQGGPNPPGTDPAAARALAGGNIGMGFAQMLQNNPAIGLVAGVVLALVLFFLIRRK